jgi:hypothetical protein
MSKMSRTKGQSGEREVIDLLQPTLDAVVRGHGLDPNNFPIQRNTVQSDRGGSDLTGLPGLAIEVKRCETLAIESWWEQCTEQAMGPRMIGFRAVPVLFYRRNRTPWRVRMLGHCGGNLGGGKDPGVLPLTPAVVDVSLDDFLKWFERWCRRWLASSAPIHTCETNCNRKH